MYLNNYSIFLYIIVKSIKQNRKKSLLYFYINKILITDTISKI